MKTASLVSLLVGFLGGLTPATAAPEQPSFEVRAIDAWTRAAGATGDDEPGRLTPLSIASFQMRTFQRTDLQYEKKVTFKGFPLSEALERAKPPAETDLALLHFSNGMAIPVPFRDAAAMKRLDAMVAVAVVNNGKSAPLPPITRKVREYVDVPTIAFAGNKIVVAEPFVSPASIGCQLSLSHPPR
jgi:hypothetical protein